MMIFVLDEGPAKCAEYLDDRTLNRQIKAIAQALCNAHHITGCYACGEGFAHLVALNPKNIEKCQWSRWARKCRANYQYLVELGLLCCFEWQFRFTNVFNPHNEIKGSIGNNRSKYHSVIEWARENVPELQEWNRSPFPLVMPEKYQKLSYWNPGNFEVETHIDNIVYAYRNYYRAKLEKFKTEPTWTRREKPEWI